eukprot:245216-Pelagomonas_calceolata.AAC.5
MVMVTESNRDLECLGTLCEGWCEVHWLGHLARASTSFTLSKNNRTRAPHSSAVLLCVAVQESLLELSQGTWSTKQS